MKSPVVNEHKDCRRDYKWHFSLQSIPFAIFSIGGWSDSECRKIHRFSFINEPATGGEKKHRKSLRLPSNWLDLKYNKSICQLPPQLKLGYVWLLGLIASLHVWAVAAVENVDFYELENFASLHASIILNDELPSIHLAAEFLCVVCETMSRHDNKP